jgi:hypothetical protein
MSIRVRRRIILVFGLTALLGLNTHALSQSPASLKSHRHLRIGESVGVDIPEFSMPETSLEAGMKKENLITSQTRKYEAFTVSGTRLFVSERATGKIFEICGLPLKWRLFSDLMWADNRTLIFDRWSQPHFGVHYAVNVKTKKLLVAAPFPDKFYLEQQRTVRPNN